jgi:hypothetical protein
MTKLRVLVLSCPDFKNNSIVHVSYLGSDPVIFCNFDNFMVTLEASICAHLLVVVVQTLHLQMIELVPSLFVDMGTHESHFNPLAEVLKFYSRPL